jgi:hypothetical protein
LTSPEDRRYNCIAWAAGLADLWWWPEQDSYWPREWRTQSLAEFTEVFASLGYEVCESRELESGFEKVAIYTRSGEPKHMARQLPSGLWTSKCGDFEDITHTLEALEGSGYGRVVVIMKRRR